MGAVRSARLCLVRRAADRRLMAARSALSPQFTLAEPRVHRRERSHWPGTVLKHIRVDPD